METVRKIMAAMEAMDEWAGGHTRIVNDPHRPLLIEWLGEAAGEGDFVSVSQTYTQGDKLMRDPEMTLERISEDAGFGSASAFSRAFKSEFGVSPKDFRAKQRKR